MTMGKRTLFFAALLMGFLCLMGTASASGHYPDMEGHWAREAVERWSDSGILKGYSDGNFHPGDPVTRAQLAEILYRVWGCEPKIGHSYVDLPSNAWYYESLSTMNAYGVALGHGERIDPEERLTREEAFYMAAKAFDLGSDSPNRTTISHMGDADEIEPSFTSRLGALFSRKALNGAPDGNFHPKDTVTRAEVMTVIDNLFDIHIHTPGEYTLPQNQVALVTSPGVTIRYDSVKYAVGADIYLMAPACRGGVSFQTADIGTVDIYGISEGKGAFTGETELYLRDNTWDLTDPKRVPDLGFAGGCGVKRDPYRIATGEQFLLIAQQPSVLKNRGTNYCYELVADVTLPERKESMYLGSQTPYLDGKGHTVTYHMKGKISGVWGDFGLFGRVDGIFSNLTLDGSVDVILDGTITDPDKKYAVAFGGLAGSASKGSSLVNCHSKLDIKVRCDRVGISSLYVGGLAGDLEEGSMTECLATGTISVLTANSAMNIDVGGLVGTLSQSSYIEVSPGVIGAPPAEERKDLIRNCGSSAIISTTGGDHTSCGGIIGLQTFKDSLDDPVGYALVESCWSTATLSASGASFQSDCGGIVGQNNAGTVRNCWAKPTISISGTYIFKNQGGICGCIADGGGHSASVIQNCWAEVSNCPPLPGDGHYGGIVARAWSCTISNCFVLGTEGYAPKNAISYDSWTTGAVSGCADLTGSDQMGWEEFYSACGWDFETVWDRSGVVPILRDCDAEAQRAVQITTGQQVIV